jgi:uncharacterized damage-inducible protein DinB
MKKHITTLFEYEKWANGQILDALTQLQETDEKSLDIMAHVLLVQMVWYSRIAGITDPPVWAKKTLDQCKEMYTVNNKILSPFITQLTDDSLKKDIEYKNTKGQKFTNTSAQILSHMFNHSTYHRGQIVERMKGKLPQMPVTDLIAFMRMK